MAVWLPFYRPQYLSITANPVVENQAEALILGNNISLGVTVPFFGKTFAEMGSINQLVYFISHNKKNIQIFPLWEMRVPIHLRVEGFKKIDTKDDPYTITIVCCI